MHALSGAERDAGCGRWGRRRGPAAAVGRDHGGRALSPIPIGRAVAGRAGDHLKNTLPSPLLMLVGVFFGGGMVRMEGLQS